MQAYLLEQPPTATDDIPESLRTAVWNREDADWYLSAYMLGLSHDQITAPIVDEATVTASSGEKQIVLFSTNYLLNGDSLTEEQKIELSRFLKMLGNPNQS